MINPETFLDAFIQSVIEENGALCMVYGESTYTRSQLLIKATQVAQTLREAGVGQGDHVLVQLPRSPQLIAAMSGIMLAGATYVPLEVGQPSKRLKTLLDLVNPAVMIADPGTLDLNAGSLPRIIEISNDFPAGDEVCPAVENQAVSDGIAYIICTSGSTGIPKGVRISHAALLNYSAWAIDEYEMEKLDGACLSSGIAFDGSLLSQVVPLACGTPIFIAPEGQDIDVLADLLQPGRKWNGLINSSPSHLDAVNPLIEQGVDKARKCVIVIGGEAVTARSMAPWLQRFPNSVLVNEYGPTEATIACCFHRITEADLEGPRIPIGRPVSGMDLTIVDPELNPVADGEQGEILISGNGVAEGYLGKKRLTAERFVTHPVSGERAYRSGDVGYRDEDGLFHFVGRTDDQVKLRGFRIELEEIRRNLADWAELSSSTVLLHETDKISQLVAFAVAGEGTTEKPDTKTMSGFLKDRLPEYMIPSRLVLIDQLPITAAGKIDNKLLLELLARSSSQNLATTDEITSTLGEIWDNLLGCGRPGEHDNFFELGGNSVKATQLIAMVKKQLGVSLRPAQVFENYLFSALVSLIQDPSNMKQAMDQATVVNSGPAIAVIGIGLNFPGARGWREFWKNLVAKEESITFFADEELDPAVQAIAKDPGYVKARGIIADADQFDARFFQMTPAEAALLDPQHRVFLEVCWEALEDGGYPPTAPQNIGVYAGCGSDTYTIQNVVPKALENGDLIDLPTRLFNDKDYLTTRVSHKFNLTGPSINVNTACSTSLVAVALAVKALREGLCDMALAGGVSVDVPINAGYRYVEGSMLSPDGHCRPFDSEAAGTMFNSGAGVVLLKPLDRAVEDGDNIIGTILGVGLNNDGADKSSFAAPSTAGQAKAIRMAQIDAGVSPDSLDFIETHGTGTPIGDPIEVEGLLRAFDGHTSRTEYCAIGSVKSNFGHLVGAAGIAGLIKSVLSLKHGLYPATLYFEKPNPQIDFPASPFYVASDHVQLPGDQAPIRCGVSSFGVGGTNAHVVMESHQKRETKSVDANMTPVPPFRIFPFSARSADSLDAMLAKMLEFAKSADEFDLADVAYTLQQRRLPMPYRATIVADRYESMLEALSKKTKIVECQKKRLPVVFMFTGQGCQYPGMARELAAKNTAFSGALQDCFTIIRNYRDVDFEDLLLGEPTEDKAHELAHTANAQPAIFAMEYSLYTALLAAGVKPDRLLGHSVGEFVAAVAAGVMSLEDALASVCERGRLMGEQPGGTMLAVMTSRDEIEQYCSDNVELAACNAPQAQVLSGPDSAITELVSRLEAAGISSKPLRTSHAFHSNMMSPAVDPLIAQMKSVGLSSAEIEIISTVTGSRIENEMTDPHYWGEQLRRPVLFVDALDQAAQSGRSIWVEVGPGTQLTTLARQKLAQDDHVLIPACSRSEDGEEFGFAEGIAQLWKHGVDIDWAALQQDEARIASLPTYEFSRQRHWIDAPARLPGQATASPVGIASAASKEVEDVIKSQIETMEAQLTLLAQRDRYNS